MLIHQVITPAQDSLVGTLVPVQVVEAWNGPLFSIGSTPVTAAMIVDELLVMKILHDAAIALPDQVDGSDPIVLLTGFGDSSIDFEVSAWVSEPWTSRRTVSNLNQSIWWKLKENSVTIPFPQRDVHMIQRKAAPDAGRPA